MRVFLLTLLLCVSAWNVYAQSPKQPLTHANRAQEAPKADERGTEHAPLVIKVLPPVNEDEKAAAAQQERKDKSESDWSLVKLTGVLAIIGVIQIVVFGLQARRLHQTVKEMKIATKATEKAADAALKTAKNMEVADRAYIKISHKPPGLVAVTPSPDLFYGPRIRTYTVQMDVRNIGKTPAEITRFVFTQLIQSSNTPLPALPSYSPILKEDAMRTIMYGSDAIDPSLNVTIEEDDVHAIMAGEKHFYLIGYAAYIDHFGTCHRAGYARRYNPLATENNLFIVIQKGYNYDRQRTPDDGSDWDDVPSKPA